MESASILDHRGRRTSISLACRWIEDAHSFTEHHIARAIDTPSLAALLGVTLVLRGTADVVISEALVLRATRRAACTEFGFITVTSSIATEGASGLEGIIGATPAHAVAHLFDITTT